MITSHGNTKVIVPVPYHSRSGDLEKKYIPQMYDNEYSSSDIFINDFAEQIAFIISFSGKGG